MTAAALSHIKYLTVVIALLLQAGCHHAETRAMKVSGIDRIRYLELRDLAEARLNCPGSRLSYQYEGNKVHVMEGCGGTVRYLIFSINNIWVKIESFHERARFQLDCSIKKMSTYRVNDTTWRVKGCDRTTYYALLCEGEGQDCLWENVPEKEFVAPMDLSRHRTSN